MHAINSPKEYNTKDNKQVYIVEEAGLEGDNNIEITNEVFYILDNKEEDPKEIAAITILISDILVIVAKPSSLTNILNRLL